MKTRTTIVISKLYEKRMEKLQAICIEYDSLKEACKENDLNYGTVKSALNRHGEYDSGCLKVFYSFTSEADEYIEKYKPLTRKQRLLSKIFKIKY